MHQRNAPATLTPLLAAVVLVACGLSGLMTGVLAHGFVASLAPTPLPTTRPSPGRQPTHPQPTATHTPVAVVPIVHFNLALAAQPQHVSPGGSLIIVATATAQSAGSPVASLLCTVGPSHLGGAPLLSKWPEPTATDAQGHATWHVTAPAGPGTYTLAVSASGSNQFVAWAYASVYVSG